MAFEQMPKMENSSQEKVENPEVDMEGIAAGSDVENVNGVNDEVIGEDAETFEGIGVEDLAAAEKGLHPRTAFGKKVKNLCMAATLFAASFSGTSVLANLDYTHLQKGDMPSTSTVQAEESVEVRLYSFTMGVKINGFMQSGLKGDPLFDQIKPLEEKYLKDGGEEEGFIEIVKAAGGQELVSEYNEWKQSQSQEKPSSSPESQESNIDQAVDKVWEDIQPILSSNIEDRSAAKKIIMNKISEAMKDSGISINAESIKEIRTKMLGKDINSLSLSGQGILGSVFNTMEKFAGSYN